MEVSRIGPLFVISLVLLGVVACGNSIRVRGELVPPWSELPETPEDLIQRADSVHASTRALGDLTEAVTCLEKAQSLQNSYSVQWRLARAYRTLAQQITSKALQRKLLRKAVQFAEMAHATDPEKPEALENLAAGRGVLATLTLAPGKAVQEGIENPAEILVENHPEYLDGAGKRILGALYAKAPPWPAGVGDLEEGLELLKENADQFPKNPMNHFFLGEALLRDGRDREAEGAFKTVLSAPRAGEWALIGATYRRMARQYLRTLQEGGSEEP